MTYAHNLRMQFILLGMSELRMQLGSWDFSKGVPKHKIKPLFCYHSHS